MKPSICTHIEIRGIVQGVGFRPFLHRLAESCHITGWVRNTSDGVEGLLKGSEEALARFEERIRKDAPPLARVEELKLSPMDATFGFDRFTIEESFAGPGSTLVSPDISICPECAAELYDPSDRRYRYPFINCTHCGPRYTIITSLPYDRKRTVMDDFPMCDDCAREYGDIRDRRYHAQPDCCPVCGPKAFFADKNGQTVDADPFYESQKLLRSGGILAVKGVGGVHLACDAMDPRAVLRLREQKNRPTRPLALMCRSLKTVENICRVTPEEAKLLESPERPIVLLRKKRSGAFTGLSFSSRLGVMLPYTPLHMLLLDGCYGGPDILVMTSGNVSGCPVITTNEEALTRLSCIADGFLLHDRRIRNRCDDSLLMEWQGQPYFFRKSRGYIPRPIYYEQDVDGLIAMGAEQKASFAMGKDDKIFVSPHIGDLKNAETFQHYTETGQTYRKLFHIQPAMYIRDLHPDYLSSQEADRLAADQGVPLLAVQHHWAHMAACMADNGLDRPCFGIIWDGTGLGTDGSIWGGEFFKGDLSGFSRAGSIRPIALAGGDAAVRQIGRVALALVLDAGGSLEQDLPLAPDTRRPLARLIASGLPPKASSIGRLFDGVCALILNKADTSYEGEAAAMLEALVPEDSPETEGAPSKDLCLPLWFYEENNVRIWDTRPLIRAVLADRAANAAPGRVALRFMTTLCYMALDQCLALNPEKLPVVLSGGVFQNRFLLSGIARLLSDNGFAVYTHRQVSPNDEGICLGQLAIAQKKRRKYDHVPGYPHEDPKHQRPLRRV